MSWPSHSGFRVSPYAWAKLMYCLHEREEEVQGFGLFKEAQPSAILDFALLPQEGSVAGNELDGKAIAVYQMEMADKGYSVPECRAISIHTHPGSCAHPSGTDEDMVTSVYDQWPWSAMIIVAKDESMTARVHFNIGPKAVVTVPCNVDWSLPFDGSNHDEWKAELDLYVTKPVVRSTMLTPWSTDHDVAPWLTDRYSASPWLGECYVADDDAQEDWWDDYTAWCKRSSSVPVAKDGLLANAMATAVEQHYGNPKEWRTAIEDWFDRTHSGRLPARSTKRWAKLYRKWTARCPLVTKG